METTNGIPICPNCKIPTIRTQGMSMVTSMYFPPTFNEKGENINPDRNVTTSEWYCNNCKKRYSTSGNIFDGFSYL